MNKLEDGQLYDVCNDYSITPCEDQNLKNMYKSRPGEIDGEAVTVFYHKHHMEIHYVYGPKGLDNKMLF